MKTMTPKPQTETRFVYSFDEPTHGGRDLLGGKGVGLSEMAHLDVPVPAGFTITTDACRAYLAAEGELPAGLEGEIEEHIRRLEQATGTSFGDPTNPLLVSVRSGAAISMPGMMDTILDLGLNDVTARGLAAATGNARFAYDSYRRLIQMYGEVVEGIDGHRFEHALDELKAERGSHDDVELTAPDLIELIERYKQIYEDGAGRPFPIDAHEQLLRAVRAVFDSWNSPRARVYRHTYEIPDDLGTAVNVMQMVFGNKGDDCATGVCFSRDPSTGERGICGEFLVNAQGEDVVAGIRLPQPLDEMRALFPAAFAELERTVERLERHYRDVQDIEFTVEQGRLYLLQTRSAKRTAAAAVRAAVAMVEEGLLSRRGCDRANRPRPARAPPPPDARSGCDVRRRRDGPRRLAGSRLRARGLRRGHRRGARAGWRGRRPRTLGDEPGRHPRPDRGEGDPDGARRDRLARRARRARDGQALRRRLLRADDRHGAPSGDDRRPRARRGRSGHGRRRHRQRHPRSGRARARAAQRGSRDDPRLGGRGPAVGGARERGHPCRRDQGARARRAGDRAVPDRAHVLRRGAPSGRPGDDPRGRRNGAPRGARTAAAVPAERLRGHLRGDGRAAGDDPAARPAAARVPPAARGGDRRAVAGAHPGAARGEPDARDARLPARPPVAGDLRDAGARDRARRPRRP